MSDRMSMWLGMVGRMGPGMRQVVEFGVRSTGKDNFGGEFGAPHRSQWEFVALLPLPKSV